MNVLTLGTFDLFHAGHVALFRRCRNLAGSGGRVIVGLNTDEFVERYKGAPPVIGYVDREAVIEACVHVDCVLPNDQPDGTAAAVIEESGADIIVVGSDWQDRDGFAARRDPGGDAPVRRAAAARSGRRVPLQPGPPAPCGRMKNRFRRK